MTNTIIAEPKWQQYSGVLLIEIIPGMFKSINQSKRNKTITTGVHADSSKHSFFLQFLVLKTAQILISAL